MGEELSCRSEEEFAEIYQKQVSLVYQICYVYLKNTADAEDAVQSVFLKYLRTNVEFKNENHEKAWMVTTAKNCCLDILKSWWRRRRVDLESLPEAVSQEMDPQAGELLQSMLSLPEKYRVVMYLRYIMGYSTKETAELLNRKESTIRSQLLRGRGKLKQKLEGERDE